MTQGVNNGPEPGDNDQSIICSSRHPSIKNTNIHDINHIIGSISSGDASSNTNNSLQTKVITIHKLN